MLRASIIGAGLLIGIAACSAALSADLTIWWNKGYYPAQDEGITRIVQGFQKDTGITVDLALYTQTDLPVKLQAALEAGQPPDVSTGAGFGAHRRHWAYEGRLVDLGDIVEPISGSIDPIMLKAAHLENGKTNQKAYYSLPLEVVSIHVHVWKSLLQQAGIGMEQIPGQWTDFWDFFCDMVQPAVRQATGKRTIYGVGLTASGNADDTENNIEEFLFAHNAWFVDDDGKLLLDRPGMRQRIIDVLTDFARFSKKGCNPPGAVSWGDIDNNINFLNQTIVMTPNQTLSIPGSHRRDNPKDYYENIATIAWPNSINGSPLPLLLVYLGVEVYAQGHNTEGAKAFLRYLIRPEHLGPYVEAAQGRYYPALAELADTPFWTDPSDPHIAMLRQQITSNPRELPMDFRSLELERVRAERVWPTAVTHIILEGWTPERAADEAIARTKEIVGQK